MGMKRISVQELKAQLSAIIAEAESGETILITRHNQAVAQLAPAEIRNFHRGRLFGASRIAPAVKRGTDGRYLEILLEDRGDR